MNAYDGLAVRQRTAEVMDDPNLDAESHVRALDGLARLNLLSGGAGILWRPLSRLVAENGMGVIRVLDIATGAGDLPVALWRRAKRRGLALDISGCDVSARALEHARARCDRAGAAVNFFKLDALQDSLPSGYDVLMCSLFLHHLETPAAELLLRRMGEAAKEMVLVNDLARGVACLRMVQTACYILTTSPVVRTDGPLSVRAAFTPDELKAMADRAGLRGASIERRWPCRMLLTWNRP